MKNYEDKIYSLGETVTGQTQAMSQAVQKTLENNGGVGIMTGSYDQNLSILSVNNLLLNSTGYTFDTFMEQTKGSLRNFFYDEEDILERDRFLQLHGTGEAQILAADGTVNNVRLCKEDATDEAGRQIWVMSVQVNWDHVNLTLLNEAIYSGFWYFDCDENSEIVNANWSHEFRKMLGYHDTLDFPNKLESWSDLLHPQDKEKVMIQLQAAIKDKTNQIKYQVEYRMRMKDNQYQWFRASAEVIRRLDGSASRIAGIFINIDGEKKEIMQAHKSAAFHRAFTKADLCEYYVNLEANTFDTFKVEPSLMTVFEQSYTWDELIRHFVDSYVVETDKKAVSSFYDRGYIAERLKGLETESGKMTLAQEDFNLSELVDNLITLTKPVLDEHKHNFDIHINHIEHEAVCGDSLRIQQVFVNLMSNAIKYTPDGGNITFSIEEKTNGFSELGCYEFTIEDNGIGMSPEFQKIMFDPFSRADDHRTTRVQGTGLGMAISRNIVNLMNGNIKVDSTLHKGTRITVTIYLELQEKEKEQDENLMNLPVLVVDDDKTCCESTIATLKEIGITGEWVLFGREAVERCYARHELKNDYFAVILDWKMPEMDGIETARQIRKRIGKEITIIVLTSYEFSEIEEEAKAAGVDAFIAKPLFRSRLTATLRQFTSGRKENTARNYLEKLSEADYTGKRILLVEDNELNREIGVEILQMTGAEVETAENGKIAVEKVEASPKGSYDLIFMDIQMPVMNGYEATAAIRSLPGEKGKLPIIAMTANAFAEDVQLAKNTGMNGHIAKPLDMNKLNDVLENWL